MTAGDGIGDSKSLQKLVAREALISAVIAGAISAAFCFALFAGQDQIALWGEKGAAFDFIPQNFMIGVLGTAIPTLGLRARLRKGALSAVARPAWPVPGKLWLRSLLAGIAGVVLASPAIIFVLSLFGPASYAFSQFLVMKVLVGAMWGGAITPLVVRMALSDKVT